MNNQSDYAQIGSTGGAVNGRVSLNECNLPAHKHKSGTLSTSSSGDHAHVHVDTLMCYHSYPGISSWATYDDIGVNNECPHTGMPTKWLNRKLNTDQAGSHVHTIVGSTDDGRGLNTPIDIRPPFYVIAYIIFKGLSNS